MLKIIAHGAFHNARCLRGREFVFGLPLKLRLTDKHRNNSRRRAHNVFGGDIGGAFGVGAFAIGAQAFGQRGA